MARFSPDTLPYYNPGVERRVCLITGGNSGIGWYTVLHLYMHGYVVYIAGRSRTRVNNAIKEIEHEARKRVSEAKTPAYRWLGELKFIEMDLLHLDSIETAVREFKTREKCLHLLINNAGVMAVPYELTDDGIEIQMQTNYLSHFLLTQRLVPMMETQPDPRIIAVSSVGHMALPFQISLDQEFNYWPNMIFTCFRYMVSKTAMIHMVKSLAVRHPNILSVAVHPGFVMNTNLFSHFTRLPLLGALIWFFFQFFGSVFGVSNEEGSYSTLKCSLSKDLSAEKDKGKYFATYGIESTPSKLACDPNYAMSSWAWATEQLVKRGHVV